MDRTLLVYDSVGKIWVQITGFYAKPEGLPYLEIEIPEGKIATGVDVSVTPHTAILEDLPVPPMDQLRADLDYLAMMGGIEL